MAGNQGLHSAENGKLGGRPPNKSTIEAQLFRNALAEHVAKKRDEYVRALDPLIFPPDGSKPNADAWAKVMDRSFGKPEQAVDVTSGGDPIRSRYVSEALENSIEVPAGFT